MSEIIITCNAGSNNIKLAVFDVKDMKCIQSLKKKNIAEVLDFMRDFSGGKIFSIGHRVVHGGQEFTRPAHITPKVLNKLKKLSPLAPLHQPYALNVIWEISKLYPEVIQVACFDTAFHRVVPEIETLTALPPKFREAGIERYGFHGISYEYIASQLPNIAGRKANGKVVVAHLGGGASMCAMKDLQSVATTMGFSTLEGLMMNTRTGSIDPGIILYLLQHMKMKVKDVSELLYRQSGLKGVSGMEPDIDNLLESESVQAKQAIDLYCYTAAKHLGGLVMALGGLDILAFTGGVGQNSPLIRRHITSYLEWMGLKLNEKANQKNDIIISAGDSKIEVLAIPANEEYIIANAARDIALLDS